METFLTLLCVFGLWAGLTWLIYLGSSGPDTSADILSRMEMRDQIHRK